MSDRAWDRFFYFAGVVMLFSLVVMACSLAVEVVMEVLR